MGAINSRDEPSWLVAAVSERLSGSTLLLLLHSLPQAAPPGQHLPLHLPKSLTSGSFSCRQSLVLPRLMVRYSWWRGSLGVTFMATNFTHSIFDPKLTIKSIDIFRPFDDFVLHVLTHNFLFICFSNISLSFLLFLQRQSLHRRRKCRPMLHPTRVFECLEHNEFKPWNTIGKYSSQSCNKNP